MNIKWHKSKVVPVLNDISLYKDIGEAEVSFQAFLPSAIGVGNHQSQDTMP
jgi:hypothetical protein